MFVQTLALSSPQQRSAALSLPKTRDSAQPLLVVRNGIANSDVLSLMYFKAKLLLQSKLSTMKLHVTQLHPTLGPAKSKQTVEPKLKWPMWSPRCFSTYQYVS
jgi:hypothetical protein